MKNDYIIKRVSRTYLLVSILTVLAATLGMMVEFSDVYNDHSMRQMYGMKEMNVTEWIIQGLFGLMNKVCL